jgi:hypothetical protein
MSAVGGYEVFPSNGGLVAVPAGTDDRAGEIGPTGTR